MKNYLKISILLLALCTMAMSTLQAQKFGYVNSNALLAELPEVKRMNANLQSLGSQLQKKGEQMVTTYKQKEETAIQKKSSRQLSPVEEEELLKELQEDQAEIYKFEQEMQKAILAKEEELTKPILEKVNAAIQQVAKENGYTMIFEAGVLLYAEEGADVSNLVKSKLGL